MEELIKSIKRDLELKSENYSKLNDKINRLSDQLNSPTYGENEVAIVGFIMSALVIFDILYILFYSTK